MKLGDDLLKIVAKTYEPGTMVELRHKGNDIAFKTDAEGRPILLFVGKRNEDGVIKGERYARTLKTDREGKIIKDHWEMKGKAT
jgi:hypothetical protein